MNTFVSHSKFKLFPTHDLRQPTLELAAKRVPNLQQNVAENGRTIQSPRLFCCQNPKQSPPNKLHSVLQLSTKKLSFFFLFLFFFVIKQSIHWWWWGRRRSNLMVHSFNIPKRQGYSCMIDWLVLLVVPLI